MRAFVLKGTTKHRLSPKPSLVPRPHLFLQTIIYYGLGMRLVNTVCRTICCCDYFSLQLLLVVQNVIHFRKTN